MQNNVKSEALGVDTHHHDEIADRVRAPGTVRFVLFGLVIGIAFLAIATLVFTFELDLLG